MWTAASYRLDAWVQGMIHAQLSRHAPVAAWRRMARAQSKPGIHLGAFGWLEDVRPHARQRADVQLPPDLVDFFAPPGAATARERRDERRLHVHAVA